MPLITLIRVLQVKPRECTHLELVSGDSGDGLDLVGSEVIGV
jgi:hypothetical protein